MAHQWNDIPVEKMMMMLGRRGLGRTVRLEFELLSIEDMKHMARELRDLADRLRDMAGATAMTPLDRLCRARYEIYNSNHRSPPRRRARIKRQPDADHAFAQ